MTFYDSRSYDPTLGGTVKACELCQERFAPVRRSQRFCSDACSKRAWKRANPDVVSASGKRYYQAHRESVIQRSERNYQNNRERRIAQSLALQRANPEKTRERSRRWRLANPDRAREIAQASRLRHLDRSRAAARLVSQRRRALTTTTAVEPFSDIDIFERDKWVCQLCKGRINKRRRYPDPRSPSLDHIIPLFLGGSHTRANVQAAHFGCNSRKGTRPANEQLRLVG